MLVRSVGIHVLIFFNIIECAAFEWKISRGRPLHLRANAIIATALSFLGLIQALCRPVGVSVEPEWGRMFRLNVSASWVLCYAAWNMKFASTVRTLMILC